MTLGQAGPVQFPDDLCSRSLPDGGRQLFSSGTKSPSLGVSPVPDLLGAGGRRGLSSGEEITTVVGIDLVEVTRR